MSWKKNFPTLVNILHTFTWIRRLLWPGLLASISLSAALLSCRLTAGPPPRPTATSSSRSATATPAGQSSRPQVLQSPPALVLTPLPPPTQTSLPTLLSTLPDGLPLIRPGNVSRLRPLARPWEENGLPLTDLAFSPDGKVLAAATCDQTVQLWETETGNTLPVPVPENRASCLGTWKLAFSPAGYLFASSTNPTEARESPYVTQLWTVSRNFGLQPLQGLPAGPRPITSLAFSPDGRVLAAGTQDNQVRLWFISDPGDPLATPITELPGLVLSDWALDIEFSPDGRWLAVGTSTHRGDRFEPAVLIWSVQDLLEAGVREATVFETLAAKSGPLHQVRFSPDGRLLASAGGGLTIWEIHENSQDNGIEEEEKPSWDERLLQEIPLPALDFSPDGLLLASGGQDLRVLVLEDTLADENATTGQWIILEQSGEEIHSLDFSPGGNVLAVLSFDGSATLWGIQR